MDFGRGPDGRLAGGLCRHHGPVGRASRQRGHDRADPQSDKWNYYQAKGIKANLLASKIELLTALGKTVEAKDRDKLEGYRKEQEAIKEEAEENERVSAAHLEHHSLLSRGVTLFQVGIAVGAISVLTKRKRFWYASLVFGGTGVLMLVWGAIAG